MFTSTRFLPGVRTSIEYSPWTISVPTDWPLSSTGKKVTKPLSIGCPSRVTRPLTDDLLPQPAIMKPTRTARVHRVCVANRVSMQEPFVSLKPIDGELSCPQYSEVAGECQEISRMAPPRLTALSVKPFLQHLGIGRIQFHKSPKFRASLWHVPHLLIANDQDFSSFRVEGIEPQHLSGFLN